MNLVSEYLSETVNFGGLRIPRHQMISELTEWAKATGRPDWRKLVDVYLAGHSRLGMRAGDPVR